MTEQRDWVDGPGIVSWLREQGLQSVHRQLTESQARRVNCWANGEAANFYTLDPILNRLGLFEWEIPENLWIESPKVNRVLSAEQREEIVMRGATEGVSEIAKAIGCSQRNVRYHLGKVPA
jgi:hypothetical protein